MRIATFGEILWDIYEQDAPILRREVGGAPANVAAGLAALGVHARVVGAVGDDRFGRALTAELASLGVDTTAIAVRPERTGITFIKCMPNGEPSFLFYRQRTADVRFETRDLVPAATAADYGLLGTSTLMTPRLRNASRAFAKGIRAYGGAVVVDLNIRPHMWRSPDMMRATIRGFLARAAIIKGSQDDFDALGMSPHAVLREWNPALVVITDRGEAARTLTARGEIRVETTKKPVVDATGAGDAFIAGFLAYFAKKKLAKADLAQVPSIVLEAALASGHALAGLVIGHVGAVRGLRDVKPLRSAHA